MIIDLLALLPEFILVGALLIMFLVNQYRRNKTSKTFYTLSKVCLCISALFALVFFNQNSFAAYLQNNSYTTLFKLAAIIMSVTCFNLSCKWFLNKNKSSYAYYTLGIADVIMLMLMISACNLAVMCVALVGHFLFQYLLIYNSSDDQELRDTSRHYLIFAIFFAVLFIIGTILLYRRTSSLNYTDIFAYYASLRHLSWYEILTYVCIASPILFMIGLAPFHFCFADMVSIGHLPVSSFYTMVPLLAGFSSFVHLCMHVFFPLIIYIKPILWIFAVISLILGAVSANREQNLRRLFASISLYNLGFIFITLYNFNSGSIIASFICLVVYMLSITGIYTVFFGLKSNGEYLADCRDVSGAFTQKPYISLAFVVFMVSLAGSPPMLGFLGKLAAVNNMVTNGNYVSVLIYIGSLLLVITAYLDVIKSLFFDDCTRKLDRADRGIYICLFLNIVIVLISILNPGYLMDNLERIFIPVL